MGLHAEQLNELPESARKVLSKLSLIIFTAAYMIFCQEENSAWRLKSLSEKNDVVVPKSIIYLLWTWQIYMGLRT